MRPRKAKFKLVIQGSYLWELGLRCYFLSNLFVKSEWIFLICIHLNCFGHIYIGVTWENEAKYPRNMPKTLTRFLFLPRLPQAYLVRNLVPCHNCACFDRGKENVSDWTFRDYIRTYCNFISLLSSIKSPWTLARMLASVQLVSSRNQRWR